MSHPRVVVATYLDPVRPTRPRPSRSPQESTPPPRDLSCTGPWTRVRVSLNRWFYPVVLLRVRTQSTRLVSPGRPNLPGFPAGPTPNCTTRPVRTTCLTTSSVDLGSCTGRTTSASSLKDVVCFSVYDTLCDGPDTTPNPLGSRTGDRDTLVGPMSGEPPCTVSGLRGVSSDLVTGTSLMSDQEWDFYVRED